MAQEAQLANRVVTSTSLPYKSNISPLESDPCFVPGSQNIMTSTSGFAERRLGFSNFVETTPTVFNNLQRLFTWERFDGTFIEMACDINSSNQAVVYKLLTGTNNSFISIYTDTSSTPFDFVVSNNTIYFTNGNVAKKYDPVNGLSNWGIAIGSINSSIGPTVAGNGADAGGALPWTNPNNVTSAVSSATNALSAFQGLTNFLQATQFGFGITSTDTVLGISVTYTDASSGNQWAIQLMKNGSLIGAAKSANATSGTFTVGSSSDLWGTTWAPNDINQTTFGVSFQGQNPNAGFSGSVGSTFDVRNVKITIFKSGGPAIVVSGSAGTFSATVGYQYVFCYGNSNTGHVSSPTPASASTGIFTNKLNVQISLVQSTDPQVNQIRLFRSTDSVAPGLIAGIYFEIPTSPYTNTTQNVTDNAPDTSLNVNSIAPIPGANDPPTPGQNPEYFSGRIWLFKNNQVFFSGLEETIIGVPEESFPSGLAGNFWNFDQGVKGLKVAGNGDSQTLMIFCPGRVYGIVGTSLDTFRRFLISNRRGARNIKSISSIGGIVAWRDTSGQVWASDGSSLQELAIDIRPDLTPYVPGNDSITFHSSGKFHWLVVSTGTKLFVFDFDIGQWMPPWTFSCNYVFSGEVSAGSYQLMAAKSTIALQLNTAATVGTYNDNGVTYTLISRSQLFGLVPDYGKRFSYASLGIYNEPGRTGWLTRVQVDTNNNVIGDILICIDDNPLDPTTVYTSIIKNVVTPQVAYNRGQGVNLLQKVYPVNNQEGRWVSIQINSANADDNLQIYDYFCSYKPLGGR